MTNIGRITLVGLVAILIFSLNAPVTHAIAPDGNNSLIRIFLRSYDAEFVYEGKGEAYLKISNVFPIIREWQVSSEKPGVFKITPKDAALMPANSYLEVDLNKDSFNKITAANGIPTPTPVHNDPSYIIEKDAKNPDNAFKIKFPIITLSVENSTSTTEIIQPYSVFIFPKNTLETKKVAHEVFHLRHKNSRDSFLELNANKSWVTLIKDSAFGTSGGKEYPVNLSINPIRNWKIKNTVAPEQLQITFINGEFVFNNTTKEKLYKINNEVVVSNTMTPVLIESSPGLYKLADNLTLWSYHLIDTKNKKIYYVNQPLGSNDYSNKTLVDDIAFEDLLDKNKKIIGFKILFKTTRVFFTNKMYSITGWGTKNAISFGMANNMDFIEWDILRPSADIYHFRHETWPTNHFWEINRTPLTITSIHQGNFGVLDKEGKKTSVAILSPVSNSAASTSRPSDSNIKTASTKPAANIPAKTSGDKAESVPFAIEFNDAHLELNRKTNELKFSAGGEVFYTQADFEITDNTVSSGIILLKKRGGATFELNLKEKTLHGITLDGNRRPTKNTTVKNSGPIYNGFAERYDISIYSGMGLPTGHFDMGGYILSYGNDLEFVKESASIYRLKHISWPKDKYFVIDITNKTIYKSNNEKATASIRINSPEPKETNTNPSAATLPDKNDFSFTAEQEKSIAKSAWIDSEKELYSQLLKDSGPYDVLVAPVQVKGHAFETSERSLMTRYLAFKISSTTELKLPNPTYVAKALGELSRTLDDNDIIRLASDVGAKTIIKTYAGHARNEKMGLKILIMKKNSSGVFVPDSWTEAYSGENIEFSHYNLPSEAFLNISGDIVKKLPFKKTKEFSAATYPSTANNLSLTEVKAFIDPTNTTPVIEAYKLQFLGSLYPAENSLIRIYVYDHLPKHYFFERSLIALQSVSLDSPDYPYLKARALFELNRRPAAIKALGTPRNAAEKALAAYMDGNLPELKKQQKLIESPLLKLISLFDTYYLTSAYYREHPDSEQIVKISKEFSGWETLIARRLLSDNQSILPTNVALKILLDNNLPVENFSLEQILTKLKSAGKEDDEVIVAMDLTVNNHRHLLLSKNGNKLCCSNGASNVTRMDYLDLISSIAILNVIKKINSPYFFLDKPSDSQLKTFQMYPPTLQEHHLMLLTKTLILLRTSSTDELAYLRVHRCARLDFPTICMNSSTPNNPHRYDYPRGDESTEFKIFAAKYLTNYNLTNATDRAKSDVAYDFVKFMYQHTDPESISAVYSSLLQVNIDIANKFIADNENRFQGSLAWKKVYELRLTANNTTDKLALSEKWIAQHPEDWNAIHTLALEYLEQKNPDKALAIFSKYEGFNHPEKYNLIKISNEAYLTALTFMGVYEFELAKKFFTVSSNTRTGSAGNLSSDFYLAIFREDYNKAMELATALSEHYDDHAIEIAMLNLTDNTSTARKKINSALKNQNNFTNSLLLFNAIEVLRKSGETDAETMNWINNDIREKLAPFAYTSLLIRSSLLDRTQADSPFNTVPLNDKRTSSDIIILDGFYWLKKHDYGKAYEDFSNKYVSKDSQNAYYMPYRVYSGIKSKKIEEVKKYLDDSYNMSTDNAPYREMSLSIIEASIGNHTAAIKHLKSAYHKSPKSTCTDDPLEFLYILSEVAELLYQDYKKDGYRDIILLSAKTQRYKKPYYAWTYAFEAKYTTNETDRLKALAITLYLDRNSSRISHFSEKDKEKALAWLKTNNPFLKKKATSVAKAL